MSIDTPPVETITPSIRTDVVAADETDSIPVEPYDTVTETGVSPVMTALAAAASAAGAAWMVSSLFRDFYAHLVAFGGVAIGIGVVIVSYRVVRAGVVQYTAVPIALLVGSILIAPDARGGTMNTPTLVADAIKSGGLLQPPVSFDPGWRMILVVLFALLASGAAAVAISSRRPKLGVLIPLPLTMGAALLQPDATEILSAAIALVCGVVGMSLAYGAELGADSRMSASFETRRTLRGGAMALGLAIAVLGLSRFNVLFPQPNRNHVVPPQRPQTADKEVDRVLFSYKFSDGKSRPLRLGVIDVYSLKDKAWELPPYDVTALRRITPPTNFPGQKVPTDPVTMTVTMSDAHGHSLPTIAGSARVTSPQKEVLDYDPRTQAIRLADKPVYSGYTYSVLAPPVPADLGKRLAASGKPAKKLEGSNVNDEFLQAPSPPNEVVTLLSQYSQFAVKQNVPEDPFNKLQFLRQAFYNKVTAAGEGKPSDLPASRVAEMLNGGNASPYEITAAEALLGRWAGIPSRIGYGYYGGDKQSDGTFQIRPKHGSTWLEVFFQGYGWQAIVGVPPKAKPSTRQNQKNEQNIQSSDELALEVYVPVEFPSIKLLFEYVRFYLAWAAAVVVPLLVAIAAYPLLVKLLRSRVRRRWGQRRGLSGRIGVAYAEFRDSARDLTLGDPSATPIEFLDEFSPDPEHEELAWLVSRALWGDLSRDLREEDAEAAERLSQSVRKRMRSNQSALNVALASIARTSLREPYTLEIPNLWPKRRMRWSNPIAPLRWSRGGARRLALSVGAGAIISMLLAGCGGAPGTARHLPGRIAPTTIGDLTFKREKVAEKKYTAAGGDSLVTDGRVFSIHAGDVIEGSFQVSLFKPKVDTTDMNDDSMSAHCIDNPLDCTGHEAFMGFQEGLGSGRFHRVYVQGQRTYVMGLSDQFIYLWFPPRTQTLAMLIVRRQFTQSAGDALRNALIAYERGQHPSPVAVPAEVPAGLIAPLQGSGTSPIPSPSGSPSASPRP